MRVSALIATIVTTASIWTTPARAEPAQADIYFVAIGSQHYAGSTNPNGPHWERVAGPVNSATKVADTLRSIGSRYGILLTSDETHAVTKADMQEAIVALKTRIRQDKSAHPLIVFYYMGHGLGDRYSETDYMVPGDLSPSVLPTQTSTWLLSKSTLSNLDVIASLETFRLPPAMSYLDRFFESDLFFNPLNMQDVLRAQRERKALEQTDDYNRARGLYPHGRIAAVPYVALFDDCYDSVVQDLTGGAASRPSPLRNLLQKFSEFAQKSMNGNLREAQSDGLVVYASHPGASIGDFADPIDDGDLLPIGSLARRFILAVHLDEPRGRINLSQLHDAMFDPRGATFGADNAIFAVNSPTPYSIQGAREGAWDAITLSVHPVSAPREGIMDNKLGTGRLAPE